MSTGGGVLGVDCNFPAGLPHLYTALPRHGGHFSQICTVMSCLPEAITCALLGAHATVVNRSVCCLKTARVAARVGGALLVLVTVGAVVGVTLGEGDAGCEVSVGFVVGVGVGLVVT